MSGTIAARLSSLGLALPNAATPVANYLPFVRHGRLLTISGQLPLVDGHLLAIGRLGETVPVEAGVEAARACFLGVLAQAAACLDGDLERIERVVRLGGFIAASADFTRHAEIMNGASDLAVAVLGDRGRHARSTVGVASLPLGAPVEIEATLAIGDTPGS